MAKIWSKTKYFNSFIKQCVEVFNNLTSNDIKRIDKIAKKIKSEKGTIEDLTNELNKLESINSTNKIIEMLSPTSNTFRAVTDGNFTEGIQHFDEILNDKIIQEKVTRIYEQSVSPRKNKLKGGGLLSWTKNKWNASSSLRNTIYVLLIFITIIASAIVVCYMGYADCNSLMRSLRYYQALFRTKLGLYTKTKQQLSSEYSSLSMERNTWYHDKLRLYGTKDNFPTDVAMEYKNRGDELTLLHDIIRFADKGSNRNLVTGTSNVISI